MRLIDAEALIDAISVHLERIEQEFDDAPTIEQKKGRCTNESRYFHCSVCDYGVQDVFEGSGKEGSKTTYVFEKGGEWNYCPNCGAKMDGGEG